MASLERASSADGSHEAELGLLRARFDLRLDVERLRTQDAGAELREACDASLREQQGAAAAQLAAVRGHYEAAAELQRASARAELARERVAGEAVADSLRAEAAAHRRHAANNAAEVEEARNAAREEAAAAAAALARAEARAASSRAVCQEEVAEARADFEKRRREQVAEVVARFEREHLELTAAAAAASAARERAVAEAEAAAARAALAPQAPLPAPPRLHAPSQASAEVQTVAALADSCEESEWPALAERLTMRGSDLEAKLYRAFACEEERLALLEARTRRAVAAQGERICELQGVVEGLFEEARQKDRDIDQARSIMAGLWPSPLAPGASDAIHSAAR